MLEKAGANFRLGGWPRVAAQGRHAGARFARETGRMSGLNAAALESVRLADLVGIPTVGLRACIGTNNSSSGGVDVVEQSLRFPNPREELWNSSAGRTLEEWGSRNNELPVRDGVEARFDKVYR